MSSSIKCILFIHNSSDLYGASRVLLQTVIFLQNKNIKCLVALPSEGHLADALIKAGIDLHVGSLGILRKKYFSILGLFNRLRSLYRAYNELGRMITKYEVDLVYSNTLAVVVGAIMARKFKLKHVWHIHEIIKQPKILLYFIEWISRLSNTKHIAVSEAVKDHWSIYLSKSRIERIYNGFDFDYLDKPSNRELWDRGNKELLYIGMIARVHYWKGQTYFLEICQALKKRGIQAKFIMVGDVFPGYEYLYEKIKETIRDLDLLEEVIDLGYREDVGHILEALDIFVLPSVAPDPLPTTVLEAMYKSKPVMATNHGGAPEMIIDGKTGLLIPFDNAIKAADLLIKFLQEKELSEIGQNAKLKVMSHFSMKTYQENIFNFLMEL